MTMTLHSFAFASGVGALLIAAAVSDLRRFVIPNWVVLALVVLYVARCGVAATAGTGLLPLLFPVPLALSLLFAGALAFQRGWLGGGDVKLIAGTALWIPAERLLDFLTLIALLGGALATLLVLTRMVREPAPAGPTQGRSLAGTGLPYGVAIAGAGLLILFNLAPF